MLSLVERFLRDRPGSLSALADELTQYADTALASSCADANCYKLIFGCLEQLAVIADDPSSQYNDVVVSCLRCTRNCLGKCQRFRNQVHNHVDSIDILFKFIRAVLIGSSENLQTLRFALQCVGNAVSDNSPLRPVVWQHFQRDQLLAKCLSHGDGKVCRFSSMIAYNLLLDDCVLSSICDSSVAEAASVINSIVSLFQVDQCEFALFALQRLLSERFASVLSMVAPSNRSTLYSIALDRLSEDETPCTRKVVGVVDRFYLLVHALVLALENSEHDATSVETHPERVSTECCGVDVCLPVLSAPRHVVADPDRVLITRLPELRLVLELLGEELVAATCCSCRGEQLVIACASLLSSVQQLSGSPGCELSAIRRAQSESSLQSSPGFGFTGLLLRVLALWVWRDRGLQLVAGRLGVVEMVLDCCRLDARQPFLQQWAVWAVRVLCQGCAENQSRLASLQLCELSEDSQRHLADMGVSADVVGQRLQLSPLPSHP